MLLRWRRGNSTSPFNESPAVIEHDTTKGIPAKETRVGALPRAWRPLCDAPDTSILLYFPMRDIYGGKVIVIHDLQGFLRQSRTEFEKSFHFNPPPSEVTIQEYDVLETLGVGGFGRVHLAKHKPSNVFYALKIVRKHRLRKIQQVKHCLNEKKILQALNFPFCVYLEKFFQDSRCLYYVLPTILGGELFRHLKKFGRMDEEHSKFYSSQVLLALEYLHSLDLVYRDLKPENILLDHTGYIKLTDFGFCKYVKGRTYTFCGTPEYLAPEVMMNKGYGKSVDWWSFGVLLYEMTSGNPPFAKEDTMTMYKRIARGKYRMPRSFSPDLKDVVRKVLQTDVSRRYGALKGGADDIKRLKWFQNIQWIPLLNKRLTPPFVPKVRNPADTSNFDKYKEEEWDYDEAVQIRFSEEFSQF